ncbi:MAG: DUF167 domain-containing protein [Promethearchaeota archaeon]
MNTSRGEINIKKKKNKSFNAKSSDSEPMIIPYKFIKLNSAVDNEFLLEVHVKPNAKVERLLLTSEELQVAVSVPPIKGKANKAVIDILARKFQISKGNLQIRHGHTSTTKIVSCSGIKIQDFLEKCKNLE